MGEPIYLENLPVTQVLSYARERGQVLWVLGGAFEPHAAHLPVGTDTFIGEEIARRVSAITGVPIAPAMHYGVHPTFHYDTLGNPIPGLLPLSRETQRMVMLDVCRGLICTGFTKIHMINAHGQGWDMESSMQDVATVLRREGKRAFFSVCTYWEIARQVIQEVMSQPFWHADEHETSCMLAISPSLVDLSACEIHQRVPLIDPSLVKRSVCSDETETFNVQDVTLVPIPEAGQAVIEGVGDPSLGTAAKGEAVLRRATEVMVRLIRDIDEHYEPDEVPKRRPETPLRVVSY